MPNEGMYYWAKLFVEQLKQGIDYSRLAPTVAIHILNDVMFDEVRDYHLEFEIRSTTHANLRLTDRFSLHTIELPKFQIAAEQVATEPEQWCFLFNHAEELEVSGSQMKLTDEAITRAVEALKVMFQTDREREIYLARKAMRDELSKKNYFETWEKKLRETEQKNQEAERKNQEAERKNQEAERKIQEAERKNQEAERKIQETERKIQEAEHRLQERRDSVIKESRDIGLREGLRQAIQLGLKSGSARLDCGFWTGCAISKMRPDCVRCRKCCLERVTGRVREGSRMRLFRSRIRHRPEDLVDRIA